MRAGHGKQRFPRDQGRLVARPVTIAAPDAEVEPFFRQIQVLFAGLHAQVDPWVVPMKLLEAGHHPIVGKGRGNQKRDV